MADVNIEVVTNVEGLDELEEAFTTGNKRAVKKFLRRVEMRAAKILQKSAEAHAPVDTGKLSEDIHRQSVMDSANGTLTVRVGPGSEAFYGMFQELGAPEANVPAQHWLQKAAEAVQNEVLEEFYTALQEGLEDMKK